MKKMPQIEGRRGFWWGLLFAIVVIGVLSRVAQTGIRIFDKYLGDALYAAMVYVILRLSGRIARVAVWAAVAMTAIRVFPAYGNRLGDARNSSLAVRLCARLLGTQFSVFDLLAYAVGIGCIAAVDSSQSPPASHAVQRPNDL